MSVMNTQVAGYLGQNAGEVNRERETEWTLIMDSHM